MFWVGIIISATKVNLQRGQEVSNNPFLDKYAKRDKRWLVRKTKATAKNPIKTLRGCDLFSGCGGITLGLHEACLAHKMKLEMVMACDLFPAAKTSYDGNFKPKYFLENPIEHYVDGELGEEKTEKEIDLIEMLGEINVVVGGPPCQGNSNLNNHTRRDDPRNELYMRMIRFVELFKPNIVLIENVRDVIKNTHQVVPRAIEILKELGYSVSNGVVKGHLIGIPQTRTRHFTVAVLDPSVDMEFEQFSKQTVENPRTVGWAIDDLQGEELGEGIFHNPPNPNPTNQQRMNYLHDHDLHELPNKERPPCQQGDHTYPTVYGRMHWNRPAPTLTTGFGCNGRGRFTHPLKPRVLTPHEAVRIQTFPDFFNFKMVTKRTEMHYLIGNAVPPLMAKHILEKLIKIQYQL